MRLGLFMLFSLVSIVNCFSGEVLAASKTLPWTATVVATLPPQPETKVGMYSSLKTRIDRLKRAIEEERAYGGKTKNIVIQNLESVKRAIEEKNTINFPMTAPEAFSSELVKHGSVKLIFGISGTNTAVYGETIGNIIRALEYLNQHHVPHHVELVVYGAMVNMFDTRITGPAGKFIQDWEEPLKRFVKNKELTVSLCRNAMTINGMVRHDIPSWVRITPMASLEIYTRVKEGYVYMTNQ